MPSLIENIIVGLLVLAAVVFLAWNLTATFRRKKGCGGGSCGCSSKPTKRS